MQSSAESNQPSSGSPEPSNTKEFPVSASEVGAQSYEDRNGQHHPIAEFLYQLTKMLTDDNSEIIEWSDGRIKVHHPDRLEGEVLHKYFRHSKFASFQRQLNYFGFRKIAGKGKMSPCSYVNENATSDIRSLLLIKRKTNGSAARKAALQQRAAALVNSAAAAAVTANPGLAAGLNLSALAGNPGLASLLSGQQALQNAMALLSENALRASLGNISAAAPAPTPTSAQLNLLALQQQQQQIQKQLLEQQRQVAQQQLAQKKQQLQDAAKNSATKASVSFAANLLKPDATESAPSSASVAAAAASNAAPSLEQLHAHLKALQQQQSQQQQRPSASSLGLAPSSSSPSASNQASAALERATAALNAMPATAAMDAATAAQTSNTNSLFDSAANLKKLLSEHQSEQNQQQQAQADQAALLNRLPSQGTLFPSGAASGGGGNPNMSFGNLLQSSNRLSSLLSLNSFLGSREQSLADIAAAMPANMRDQLAAANAAQQLDSASKFRAAPSSNNGGNNNN